MTPIYIDRKRPQKNLWLRKRQAAEWHKKQDGIWMNFRTQDYGLRRRTAWKNKRRWQRRPPRSQPWVALGERNTGREKGARVSLHTGPSCLHQTHIRTLGKQWEKKEDAEDQRASGHRKIPSVNRLRTSPLPPAPPASHPAPHAHTTQGHILICYWRLHL